MTTDTFDPSPQTIRRKVDTETYEDIASGARSFVEAVESDDVMEGDFFVFVEMVDGKASREVVRKVSTVIYYENADLYIAGLAPTEFRSMESLFSSGAMIMGHLVTRQNGETTNVYGPVSLPILSATYVNPLQVNQFLGVDVWPDGQYSILLHAEPKAVESGEQDITVLETHVLARTLIENENGEPVDQFLAADTRFLNAGQLRDLFGNPITPHIGDLSDYGLDETNQTKVDRVEEIEGAE